MTDDKLKEILLEQMYALNRVETNDKFIDLRKVEWQNTVETYQAKRIQKLYFYWKNRRYGYIYYKLHTMLFYTIPFVTLYTTLYFAIFFIWHILFYLCLVYVYSMLKVKLDKHKREKTRGKRDAEVALYKAVGHFYRGYRARQIFRCVYI